MAELRSGASPQWGKDQAKEFLRTLVEHRRSLNGSTAVEVARAMEVVPEVVYRLENCERDTRLSTLLRYCHVLGISLMVGKVQWHDDLGADHGGGGGGG